MQKLPLCLFLVLAACGPDDRATDDDSGDGPACELAGSWSGFAPSSSTFAGSSLTLDFAAGGVGHFRLGESEDSPLQTDTSYELEDGELVMNDAKRVGVFYGCDPAEVGRFRVHFGDDCGSLQLELVSDACDQRGDVLGGAQLTLATP